MRLKLTLAYDGRRLHGWQYQEGLPTVQGLLSAAFEKIGLGPVMPVAAGRTDAGVHAWAMVAHADVPGEDGRPLERYLTGLNHALPEQVQVHRVAMVEDSFDARKSALWRGYAYAIWPQRVMRPDLAGRAAHGWLVDEAKLRDALEWLPLGEHDFSGFRDAECQSRTPLCTLLGRQMTVDAQGVVWLHIWADHFLHHMVRNLVGTWLEIGRSQRPASNLREVLNGRDRRAAGPTGAADGLYFAHVTYPLHTEHEVVGERWDLGWSSVKDGLR